MVLLQQRQVDLLDSLQLDCQLSHRRGASIQAPERFAILDLVAQGGNRRGLSVFLKQEVVDPSLGERYSK